ncbi:MAG: T9SS type A sorting domain-containing protein [bacterium]|nr:T9SS type A sorting domain-containing protein [bacterium]
MHRLLFAQSALLLTVSVLMGVAPVVAQNNACQWDTTGLPLRQGHHIEWTRSGYRSDDGHVLMAWSDTRGGDRDIFIQLISPSGEQLLDSTGHKLVTFPFRQEDPEVVAVTDGWIIAWNEFRTDSVGDVYAMKLDQSGNLFPGWNPLGNVVDSLFGAAVNEVTVRAVHDGAGGAIIAWEDTRRDNADIYAQRIRSNGSIAWTTGPVAVTAMNGEQAGITADADGQGNMLVAWNDTRTTDNENIYVAKVDTSGQLPWGQNGTLVCGALGSQSAVKICPDGLGGCYLAWMDYRVNGIETDLYIQRMDASGQAVWDDGGMPLCSAPNDQDGARVAISENGGTSDGCIVTWQDRREDNHTNDVYVQKISLDGQIQFAAGGLRVCTSTEIINREGSRLTSDLMGGMVVAWEDARSTGSPQQCDLYARRILANGTSGWDDDGNGTLVADGPNQQFAPLLRLDEGDGCYVLYDDTWLGSQTLRYQKLELDNGDSMLDPAETFIVYGLDGDAENAQAIDLTMGRVAIVWQDNRYVTAGTGLFYQIVDTTQRDADFELILNGDTLAPDNEGNVKFNQVNHRLCSDGAAGFFAAWEDLRTGEKKIRMTHVNLSGQIVGSRAGTVVYNDAQTTDQVSAYLCSDGAGGCYIAWQNYDLDYYINAFVMRMDANCQPMWTEPARLFDTGEDDIVFGISAGADGCAWVTWRTGAYGQFNVAGARVCGDGSISWEGLVCDAINIQDYPTVLADGNGGAYFVWADKRIPASDLDIYAQHLNSDGSPNWEASGRLIVSDTLNQSTPRIALTSAGQLYIIWEDYRSTGHIDLYGQKLSPTGTPLWPDGGRGLALAQGDQTDAALHVDWQDGLYLAWSDYRGFFPSVYGTHINPQGVEADPFWQASMGGWICDEYQWQIKPGIARDGHGGLIVAWEDRRASGKQPLKNIWANWINDYTVSVDELPTTAIPTHAELGQNYPNPFNPSTRFAFSVPQTQRVEVAVFNTLGQQVATLVNATMNAGRYEISFDAGRLASGLYFYRLKTGNFTDVKKMMLVR